MALKGKARLYLRGIMIFLALLLPLISLLPLGWLWLWQNGYALYWLAAAFSLSVIGYLVQAAALRRTIKQSPELEPRDDIDAMPPDPGWTAREQAAWSAVEAVAADVQPTELGDRDRALNLGLRTIETVARQIHPQDRNPLWKFTIPEALALVERVSADLRPFVIDNIPLGDQLTVGQVLKIYRWRSAIGMAERAYDIWRLVRLINPVSAAAQEAREQITKRLYANVRDQLAKQLARAYVREVGRAAIDLYGGRLRVSQAALAEHVSASTLRDRIAAADMAEPLRLLVAGRAGAGKSSLVNALAKEVRAVVDAPGGTRDFQAYELELEGLADTLVIDSPPIGATAKEQKQFAAKAGESDIIVWTVAADQKDGTYDEAALAGMREHFAARPHRRTPPILIALTHIDSLPGVSSTGHGPMASQSAVVKLVREVSSALQVPHDDVVPVSLAAGRAPYNIEQLTRRIAARVPNAKQAQLLRLMEDAAPRWSVRRLFGQAGKAAWSAARTLNPMNLKR